MADDVKQRLDTLDRLAELFFGMHRSDSGSDYFEKKMKALRLLQPHMEKREIKAPCAGTVASLEVFEDSSISSWMKADPIMRIGDEEVSAGSMGHVEKVHVKEGETVEAGQTLVTMRAYRGTP